MTGIQSTSPAEQAPATDPGAVFRSRVWLTLGALLRRTPDRDLLDSVVRLARETAAVDPDEPGAADGALGHALAGLADGAESAEPGPLDDEFHDLFIGIGRGELVPYGSWYRTGFLMDRPLVALRRDLTLLGFERDPDVREPEDHAAALAEVMGLLADPAEGQDDSTQRLFFAEHVEPWFPAFFADLEAARTADFYRAVGRAGSAFVAFERRWLGTDAPGAAQYHTGAQPS